MAGARRGGTPSPSPKVRISSDGTLEHHRVPEGYSARTNQSLEFGGASSQDFVNNCSNTFCCRNWRKLSGFIKKRSSDLTWWSLRTPAGTRGIFFIVGVGVFFLRTLSSTITTRLSWKNQQRLNKNLHLVELQNTQQVPEESLSSISTILGVVVFHQNFVNNNNISSYYFCRKIPQLPFPLSYIRASTQTIIELFLFNCYFFNFEN